MAHIITVQILLHEDADDFDIAALADELIGSMEDIFDACEVERCDVVLDPITSRIRNEVDELRASGG